MTLPVTFPVNDRRAAGGRADPVCRTCSGGQVQALVRTAAAVYFRCDSCNRVWAELKPGASSSIRDAFQALGIT